MPPRLPALALLAALGCDDTITPSVDDPSPARRRSCEVVLGAEIPAGIAQVAAAGSFNDWDPRPMTDPDGDGVANLDLGRLQPGTYAWKLVLDGTYEGDPPPDRPTTWEGGFENRALVVGDCERPLLEPVAVDRDAAHLAFTRGAGGALLDRLEVTVGGVPVEPTIDAGAIRVPLDPDTPGKQSVVARAWDTDGVEAEGSPVFLPVWPQSPGEAWNEGVLYFVFVDRFRDGGPDPEAPIVGHSEGTGYRGGDLVGLRDALREGFFDDLGVTGLWLSPVVDNPDGAWPGRGSDTYTGYHGYWPVQPRTVEGRLGTAEVPLDEALRQVIDEAHTRGIRVMLDLVLNHVHEQHPWVSEHPEWFDLDASCVCGDPGCGWEEQARTCRFAPYLPDVEFREQGAVDAMVEEAAWWVRTFDVDGLRVDAAKHMDHVIMRTLAHRFRTRIEDVGGARILLLGETFVGPGQQDVIRRYVSDHELDGQFDFPVYHRLREALRDGGSFRGLAAEVRASEAAYAPHVHDMSAFFGNHDVPRLATELHGCADWGALWGVCADPLAAGDPTAVTPDQQRLVDRIALAWLFTITQPGPPLLYYGDEIGLAGAGDPDNRRDRPWGPRTAAQDALYQRVAALGQLRTRDRALQHGERRELWVDDDLYVYARATPEGEVAIVWMSRFADGSRTVPLPESLPVDGPLRDALGSEGATASGRQLVLRVRPWSGGVLVP